MLSPWLELPDATDARAQLSAWSEVSGLDLVELGTTATAEQITDTAITQPLVVAATLLAHAELTKRTEGSLLANAVIAGHSVGEIAAYAIAGVISADDAVVLARLEQLDLVPANRNAVGQIVAAGRLTALDKLAEDPPARARIRKLATAGAFHTEFMAPTLDRSEE